MSADRQALRSITLLMVALASMVFMSACHGKPVAVTTYHSDNLRTGWNSHEDQLTPHKVAGPHFGLLQSVALDDQVDAQPLVVPDEMITTGVSPGKHDVVYVATEGDTIYAIEAASGAVLLSKNFGPPVPILTDPTVPAYGCGNNGPNIGINGTPVIDLSSNTMYAIVYTYESGVPIYRIHEINLSDLTDKVPPVQITASHTLTNSTSFQFNAGWQRQRPGLLEANGNIYAGFGSFCDWGGPQARGWLLGWRAGSLTPLPANQLNDQLASSPANFFLSSIWMSGYGVAADPGGHLYFVSGNSDSNLAGGYYTTYNGTPTYANIQDSVVRIRPDLSQVHDLFTPWDMPYLDQVDQDFGSGGALLLPDQSGSLPHLVSAAGKDGRMYLLNRDHLGGFGTGPEGSDNVVAEASIGACWCGPSYFESDGIGKIVSSGGSKVMIWEVRTTPDVSLVHEGTSPVVGGASVQDSGFFTAVSSNGPADAIIWAVSRADSSSNPPQVLLYAFDARLSGGSSQLTQLFEQPAGTWPNTGGNANIVPVVVNGKVYVASNKQLSIFGLH
jgi:hypothetical protein